MGPEERKLEMLKKTLATTVADMQAQLVMLSSELELANSKEEIIRVGRNVQLLKAQFDQI